MSQGMAVAVHEISRRPTLAALAADLAAGRTTSRELVEAALERIADPAGEGVRALLKVYEREARAVADAQDQLRQSGYVAWPLAGIPISIKDLFDVAGEVTLRARDVGSGYEGLPEQADREKVG